MYSDKKYNFENELLEPKIAKTDQLAKAVSATELGPFNKASVQLINQDKDVLELVAFRDQRASCSFQQIPVWCLKDSRLILTKFLTVVWW